MKVHSLTSNVAESADLAIFKELLLRTCGHSFENEREQALLAGLCRRMAALGLNATDAYYSLLLRDNDELLRLTELLTVNETYFLREPEHLGMMVDKLLPEIMGGGRKRPVRILSAGCSTGEEPYSIAIMLRERFGPESEHLFAITGVDIDSTVIATARQGVYGKSSFRGMDRALLERYFEPYDSCRFKVGDFIRKQVGFEVVNLLGSSYPLRMQSPDIILYRNVSIYFPGQVQREIFGKLAELLVEGGCLLVGASETIHHDIGILSLVKEDSLFFYRKLPPLVFEERRGAARSLSGAGRIGGVLVQQIAPGATVRPESTQARTRRMPVHERRSDAESSISCTKQPDLSRQPDVRKRFDAAIEMAHDRQYDKALDILNEIIEQDGAFVKAYCLKGSLLLNAARFDEARTLCEAVLERDPLCLEAYLMLGMTARQDGNNDGALKRFREAIFLDASCWLAHFYSAEIWYLQQDEKRARSGYETALRILEKGSLQEHGREFFPLSFNAEQFMAICRHKLSSLVSSSAASSTAKSVQARKQHSISGLMKRNG